jgi:hypothetical protein
MQVEATVAKNRLTTASQKSIRAQRTIIERAITTLEYRFIYGTASDSLCFVTDAPVTERVRLLDSLSIGSLIKDAEGIRAARRPATSIGILEG